MRLEETLLTGPCSNRYVTALPFAANFAAGAIAGISEILTFYPLGESQRILCDSFH